jgi:hypothetical protein
VLRYGSRKASLTTTLMTTGIPENVLKAAEQIQLRDLLDSPTFQPWIVSALSNSTHNGNEPGNLTDEDDQFLQFRVRQMMRAIPYEIRRDCFAETGRIIRERKAAKE